MKIEAVNRYINAKLGDLVMEEHIINQHLWLLGGSLWSLS